MNRFVNFFDRLRFIFSAKYRREVRAKETKDESKAMYSRGEKLWKVINAKLSKISDDSNGFEKRKEFKKSLAPLSPKDLASLSLYLECQVKQINENFDEITSVVHEKLERERLQEFNMYIAYITSLI